MIIVIIVKQIKIEKYYKYLYDRYNFNELKLNMKNKLHVIFFKKQ